MIRKCPYLQGPGPFVRLAPVLIIQQLPPNQHIHHLPRLLDSSLELVVPNRVIPFGEVGDGLKVNAVPHLDSSNGRAEGLDDGVEVGGGDLVGNSFENNVADLRGSCLVPDHGQELRLDGGPSATLPHLLLEVLVAGPKRIGVERWVDVAVERVKHLNVRLLQAATVIGATDDSPLEEEQHEGQVLAHRVSHDSDELVAKFFTQEVIFVPLGIVAEQGVIRFVVEVDVIGVIVEEEKGILAVQAKGELPKKKKVGSIVGDVVHLALEPGSGP